MPGTTDQPLVEVDEQGDGTVQIFDPSDHTDHLGDTDGAGTDQTTRTGEDDHADAAALANATSDADREAIRARRRQERADKKAAARERETSLRDELAARDRMIAELSQRLMGVEQRGVVADIEQLDTAAQRANSAVNYYKGVIEEATKKQDGATVAEAIDKMGMAKAEALRLAQVKHHVTQRAQSAAPALDPSVKNHGMAWIERNKWYDPNGGDTDSSIVLTIDRRLAQDGFDPRSEAYWRELDKRVATYLPHRGQKSGYTTDDSPSGKPGRTPVAGSGREGGAGGAGSKGGSYTLSADRVKALKDAGVWDDPKARSDAIRRYRDYDRQHQA